MNCTTDERATTHAEDKEKEKAERAIVRRMIKLMNYEELHHLRFFAYGLTKAKNSKKYAQKSNKND